MAHENVAARILSSGALSRFAALLQLCEDRDRGDLIGVLARQVERCEHIVAGSLRECPLPELGTEDEPQRDTLPDLDVLQPGWQVLNEDGEVVVSDCSSKERALSVARDIAEVRAATHYVRSPKRDTLEAVEPECEVAS